MEASNVNGDNYNGIQWKHRMSMETIIMEYNGSIETKQRGES